MSSPGYTLPEACLVKEYVTIQKGVLANALDLICYLRVSSAGAIRERATDFYYDLRTAVDHPEYSPFVLPNNSQAAFEREDAGIKLLTAREFVANYCAASGISEVHYYTHFLPLPDRLGPNGWASVKNDPLSIRNHMQLYAPYPNDVFGELIS